MVKCEMCGSDMKVRYIGVVTDKDGEPFHASDKKESNIKLCCTNCVYAMPYSKYGI